VKKLHYIFLLVFLGSILSTVFQYLPLIEEETVSKTLSKKSGSSENDDSDDDSDPDNDDDTDDLFHNSNFDHIVLYSSGTVFNNSVSDIIQSPQSIQTPPPKI